MVSTSTARARWIDRNVSPCFVALSFGFAFVEDGLREDFETEERACGELSVRIIEDFHRSSRLNIAAASGRNQYTCINERPLHEPSRHAPRRRETSSSISSQPSGVIPGFRISERELS